jgi:phosphatidylserine decarboxylase
MTTQGGSAEPVGTRGFRLAPEGRGLVAAATALAVPALIAALVVDRWLVWVAAGVLAGLALCTALFFRDPVRTGPRGEDLVLSAADGQVLGAAEVQAVPYLEGPALRVSVFLSLLDVHVNWCPVSGRVEWREVRSGGYEPAWRESASEGNASVSLGICRDDGRRIVVRQVVGFVARRIVNHAREGDYVEQGERIGIMRFGSRVDIFLPPDAEVVAERGDHAVGGKTVLARLGPEAGTGGGGMGPMASDPDGGSRESS